MGLPVLPASWRPLAAACAGTAVGVAILESLPMGWMAAGVGLALGAAAGAPAAWAEGRARCLIACLPAFAGAAGPLGLALGSLGGVIAAAWWGAQAPSSAEQLLERHRQRLLRYPLLLSACPGLGTARDIDQVAEALRNAGERVLGSQGRLLVHQRHADGWRLDARGNLAAATQAELVAAWESPRAVPLDDGRLLMAVRPNGGKDSLGLMLDARWLAGSPDDLHRELLEILARLGAMALGSALLLQHTRHLALRDPVTGLLGGYELRRRLDEQVSLARRSGGNLGLLWCDLDRLKAFNDRWGHGAGDGALRLLARCLTELGGDGTAGRLGGEEFALVLPCCDATRCGAIAEAVRQAVAHGLPEVMHPEARVTVSIGWTLLRDGDDGASALARADAACYRAKANGRNRVEAA